MSGRAIVAAALRSEPYVMSPPPCLSPRWQHAQRLFTPRVADRHEQSRKALSHYLRDQARLLAEGRAAGSAKRRPPVCGVREPSGGTFEELGQATVGVIPNGVDCRPIFGATSRSYARQAHRPFLGSPSWRPNATRLLLAREVMLLVRETVPDARSCRLFARPMSWPFRSRPGRYPPQDPGGVRGGAPGREHPGGSGGYRGRFGPPLDPGAARGLCRRTGLRARQCESRDPAGSGGSAAGARAVRLDIHRRSGF